MVHTPMVVCRHSNVEGGGGDRVDGDNPYDGHDTLS